MRPRPNLGWFEQGWADFDQGSNTAEEGQTEFRQLPGPLQNIFCLNCRARPLAQTAATTLGPHKHGLNGSQALQTIGNLWTDAVEVVLSQAKQGGYLPLALGVVVENSMCLEPFFLTQLALRTMSHHLDNNHSPRRFVPHCGLEYCVACRLRRSRPQTRPRVRLAKIEPKLVDTVRRTADSN